MLCAEEKRPMPPPASQLGGWVLDDGFKAGVGCQNTLADVIDRRGQQGYAVGVAAVQVHFCANLGFDCGYVWCTSTAVRAS